MAKHRWLQTTINQLITARYINSHSPTVSTLQGQLSLPSLRGK